MKALKNLIAKSKLKMGEKSKKIKKAEEQWNDKKIEKE